MLEIEIDFVTSDLLSMKIIDLAQQEGIETSDIHDAGSDAEALNAPLGGVGEVLIAAKIITAVFSAGSAVITFLIKLRELMKPGDAVTVRSKDGRLHPITQDTSDTEIQKICQ